jgi:phospholipid/cholesterol/gamma-HCH transport system substrate-binding protein
MGLVIVLVLVTVGGGLVAARVLDKNDRTHIVAFFDNTNGLFAGDDVRILGVTVGAIESIEPQSQRVKVAFWVNDKYKVPADADALIISPQLVTARAIQLSPAYTSGPVMADGVTISEDRTAVPLEWDDLRRQLEKLTNALQPTEPGGVSTLGAFVNTAADNLRGQGADIRETVVEMSKALSALGDHSDDAFATVRNLSVVVSALENSSSLLQQLNRNMAAATGLLTDDPGAVGTAIRDLNAVVTDATQFIEENRETLGTTTDKLASITTTIHSNLDGIKQALHVFPNAAANLANVYQPSQTALTGGLAPNNLADLLKFVCGSVAAASRAGQEQSSKLCVQYLAPILKNRQMNFLPIGLNPFVGQSARPNELTYSEDRLRPDFVPPASVQAPMAPLGDIPPQTATTDPAEGLPGMMLPAEGGS